MPKAIESHFLDHPEVRKFFQNEMKTLVTESDRGAVLIGHSIIDEQLIKLFETIASKKLSKTNLNRILKYPGPLSTFSARLDVAFLNRLIDENLYNSIQKFNKIRNAVAHKPNSFYLKDYQNELFEIYNLGTGLSNHLRKASGEVILKSWVEKFLKKEINFGNRKIKLFENAEEILETIQNSSEAMSTFEEKLYRVELGFAVGIICGLIILYREKAGQILGESKLISSLNKQK